jgi:hypothetical protein
MPLVSTKNRPLLPDPARRKYKKVGRRPTLRHSPQHGPIRLLNEYNRIPQARKGIAALPAACGARREQGARERSEPGSAAKSQPQAARASSRIIAAPFSPIMMVGALVLPVVTVGITEASTTRSRPTPRTRGL